MTSRRDAILGWLEAHAGEAIAFLEALVNQDSGTYDREAVNRVGEMLARAYADLGFSVERIPQTEFGDHILARRVGTAPGKSLLCIGHMDTVFPAGTAASRPFRIGPGAPPVLAWWT